VRVLLMVMLALTVIAIPAPARAQALGGFTLSAEAAPVAVQIFEPALPIPAEPQLELNLAYSRAKLESGPTGRGVASLLWPGDTVGYGLPELLKNPDAVYPVKVEAASPSGPKDAKQEPVAGTGMAVHADDTSVESTAYLAKPTTPTLPVLPLSGFTIPSLLVGIEGYTSQSKATAAADKATATAYATAVSVSLLGGLVKVDGLRADTSAVSDGAKGTVTGTVTWTSLSLAGQQIAVNQDGVASPIGVTALPKLPADVTERLAGFGLSLGLPKVTKTAEGTGATVAGQGLTVTLDTAVIRQRLGVGAILDPVLALLPADLLTQLTPWLNLGPKFVFVLGTSTSRATATAAAATEAPPAATGPGGGGDAGTGPAGGTGDVGPATGDSTAPVAQGRGYPVFPGVPWYLFVIGLGAAAAMSFGLRRFVGLMFGAGGCDLGAQDAVPNLREL
jgi:hypothetical protein